MQKNPISACAMPKTLLFRLVMKQFSVFLYRELKQLFVLSGLFPLLTFLLVTSASASEVSHPLRAFDEKEQTQNLDYLKEKFGNNKTLPEGFELQALLALSHFPELHDIKIRFILGDVNIPLSSRPYWRSMLNSSKNRIYHIIIDEFLEGGKKGSREALLLKNQPFNAQIGIIGHELSHTAYYLDRSFFGIAKDALCQLGDCRIAFERNTDLRLIAHGLGWQRYDHSVFVRSRLNNSNAEPFILDGGGGAYMSPAEILERINENEKYATVIRPSSE